MSKKRIHQNRPERALLTEVAPFETPILFSYWGAYNYSVNITDAPSFLKLLFTPQKGKLSIPFKYQIKKGTDSVRRLSLLHPKHAKDISDFYKNFDIFITKFCKKSPFSLRAPHGVAKYYKSSEPGSAEIKEIEDITAEKAYASSYFTYSRFSHLYKFFESDEFSELGAV